jgi:stage V sporulation protein B
MPLISIIIPARLVAVGWTTSQAIAQFGIVAGMTLPLLTIPGTIISSLATALVPELSGALHKNDTAAVSRQVTGALKFTLFITFLLLPAYMALGDAIGLFLYDNTLSGAYLARSAWVMVPLAMSQITNAILNSLGAETKAMKHYIFGSIALFLTVFFLPPVIGVVALPIGMGLCMLIASVLNLRMIKKLTGANSQIVRLCVWFALISIPSLLVGHFVFGVAGHVWPMVISLPIAGAVSVGSVLLLCRVFNLVDFSNFRLTKNKKKV